MHTHRQICVAQSRVPAYLGRKEPEAACSTSVCCSLLFTTWYGYVATEATIFDAPPMPAEIRAGWASGDSNGGESELRFHLLVVLLRAQTLGQLFEILVHRELRREREHQSISSDSSGLTWMAPCEVSSSAGTRPLYSPRSPSSRAMHRSASAAKERL